MVRILSATTSASSSAVASENTTPRTGISLWRKATLQELDPYTFRLHLPMELRDLAPVLLVLGQRHANIRLGLLVCLSHPDHPHYPIS
jgi:hypothetical protein